MIQTIITSEILYKFVIPLISTITIPIIVLYIETKLEKSKNEIELHNKISQVREKYQDMLCEKEVSEEKFYLYTENYINMYEIACSFYFSNKVDKNNFDILFYREIINIVEGLMKGDDINKFPSIYKYYKYKKYNKQHDIQYNLFIAIITIIIFISLSILFYKVII
ncbi:hypothetical protein [Brachyspira innocens]|uniref:hypothetical protein n=1 Tax=Brachyspira innocens TaxID=13264 RepID=UPI000372C74A|nr:hypothetical protein [Brachyspira innocens]